jgi:hypothetical protein
MLIHKFHPLAQIFVEAYSTLCLRNLWINGSANLSYNLAVSQGYYNIYVTDFFVMSVT